MSFEILLAKSCDEMKTGERIPTYARLYPHLKSVEDAGKAILEAVGEKVLRQANLNSEVWSGRLAIALPIACLCHGIGKANDGFQKMVHGRISPTARPMRHELLSALLLVEEGEVRTWVLKGLCQNDNKERRTFSMNCKREICPCRLITAVSNMKTAKTDIGG